MGYTDSNFSDPIQFAEAYGLKPGRRVTVLVGNSFLPAYEEDNGFIVWDAQKYLRNGYRAVFQGEEGVFRAKWFQQSGVGYLERAYAKYRTMRRLEVWTSTSMWDWTDNPAKATGQNSKPTRIALRASGW